VVIAQLARRTEPADERETSFGAGWSRATACPRARTDEAGLVGEDDGFLVHPVQGIGVKNARAARRLTALLRAAKDRQAPKLAISSPEFAGPLSPGGFQQERLDEQPGIYVLACILRTQDGREQTQLGRNERSRSSNRDRAARRRGFAR
jgi:hypothetical protein